MTNNWTDIGNSTFVFAMGANPSENHPACMAHINRARNGGYTFVDACGNSHTSNKVKAELWVVDPRKTRTAALADRYIRIRPGTDIAFINGVVRYIIENMEANAVFDSSHNTAWKAYMDDASYSLNAMDDQGVRGTSVLTGRSKYTDARLLVNTTSKDDYARDLHIDASGNSVSNAPKVGSAYNAASTVFTTLRGHVAQYTLAEVAGICGCTQQDIIDVATQFVKNSRCASIDVSGNFVGDPTSASHRATTMLYAMGITQHTYGSQNVKSFAVIQTLMGNAGRAGGGINALRGIHNVQGSTDMGLLYHLIPGYSGNPSLQVNEDGQAFGKYMDALYGIRLSGNKYARLQVNGADTSGNLLFVAKVAGGDASGNSRISVEIVQGTDASLNTTTAVNGVAIKVTLGTDGSGNANATATAVKASVDASGNGLVGVACFGSGASLPGTVAATNLTNGRGANYAQRTFNGADTSGNLIFTAKTAGLVGNKVKVDLDGSGNGLTQAVAVTDYTITVTLATDGSGNVTSTAAAIRAAVAANTAANALVRVGVTGDGSGLAGDNAGPLALQNGIDCTYNYAGSPNAYTPGANPGVMGLQQNGFYNMTRQWFGQITSTPGVASDMDKMYSLWPKVNGTNHIQMFRNMADTGSVTWQEYKFQDASGNKVDTAIISPSTTAVKKGIKAGSVHIRPAGGGTEYVEGTDYRVNYPGNTFTRIKEGAIAPGATVEISYDYGIRAAVVYGQNPAVTEPNQSKVRAGLKNLDLLVCVDMFANETAMCDRKANSVTYLIPACSHVEEPGSVTNSGRVLQWRYAATTPRGNSRTDIEIIFKLAKALAEAGAFTHISSVWRNFSTPLDYSGNAFWTKMWKDHYDPSGNLMDSSGNVLSADAFVENVYKEMCTKVDNSGNTGGTLWLYTVGYNGTGLPIDAQPTWYPNKWTVANRAKSRDNSDLWGTLTVNRWGYAWLVNRRVLYNNGDVWRSSMRAADPSGNKAAADEPDAYQGPEACSRLFVSNNSAVIDYADQKYRTIHRMSDVPKTPSGGTPTGATYAGRFPWHTEPYESPREDLALKYGYNSSGTAGNLLLSGTPRGTVATYPLVLTTIRCVEHFQGGPITRNNPANHEAEPVPWIELNSVDALNLGITDGQWVKVITARTDGNAADPSGNANTIRTDASGNLLFPNAAYGQGFKARVGAGAQSNQRVGQGVVAIPWHWGEQGLSTGSRANDVCIDAMDANTTIPEYKACLCRLVKM